jgi:hypothetical protein
MKKVRIIIYWVSTIWLSVGMLSNGIIQLLKVENEVIRISNMGYPEYMLHILGVWKILGVLAILLPRFTLIKEWAYAGFFFLMSSAFASHLAVHGTFFEIIPSIVLLIMTCLSWYFRPQNRRISN